jgi:hypothetical protein
MIGRPSAAAGRWTEVGLVGFTLAGGAAIFVPEHRTSS